MDTEVVTQSLGETGIAGVAAVALGLLILARENRRAALGAVAIIAGYALIGHGLTGAFLKSMGMDYDDLFE
ncbi:MAG: hypothetical protein ACI8UR_000185 [Natronomonas sp.]|jgi:hypothetical protein|uniref:DUF7470 family protein n=1 Tax=Natronomonas sp. TaxID=2184060 RepID=UPI0039897AA2